MYYLLNETNQIVGADDSLLKICKVSDVNDLFSKMLLGDIVFSPLEDNKVMINNNKTSQVYKTQQVPLSSMLGKLTIVTLIEENVQESLSSDSGDDDITFRLEDVKGPNLEAASHALNMLDLDDEDILESIPVQVEKIKPEESSIEEEIDLSSDDLDNETLNLLYPEGSKGDDDIQPNIKNDEEPLLTFDLPDETKAVEIKDNKISEDMELFSLKADHESEQHPETPVEESLSDLTLDDLSIEDISQDSTETKATNEDTMMHDILIDSASISRKIGVSESDYRLFLNEYIDTALASEEKLKSNDPQEKSHSMRTLSHLAEVLHLPMVGEIISKIDNASVQVQSDMINSFYSTLSKLAIDETPIEVTTKPKVQTTDTVDEISLSTESSSVQDVNLSLNNLPSLDLDNVTPIHFDFLLEEAATELSLPASLIEEFVIDFIEQAHEETPKMIDAYNKGDIDNVRRIGHLLKGASSNLRITPLADTLYQIQFCEDTDKLAGFIKDYWAHFLSFEKQISLTKN